jgi:hypothetical protein
VADETLVVVSVRGEPGAEFSRKDFLLIEDFARFTRSVVLRAKKYWEMTEEKLKISGMLTQLSPFVPQSVLAMLKKNPELSSGLENEVFWTQIKAEPPIFRLPLIGFYFMFKYFRTAALKVSASCHIAK